MVGRIGLEPTTLQRATVLQTACLASLHTYRFKWWSRTLSYRYHDSVLTTFTYKFEYLRQHSSLKSTTPNVNWYPALLLGSKGRTVSLHIKPTKKFLTARCHMVSVTRIELVTFALSARRSNRLSYTEINKMELLFFPNKSFL